MSVDGHTAPQCDHGADSSVKPRRSRLSRLAELTGQRPPAATLPPGLAISETDVAGLSPAQLQTVMRALISAEGDAAGVPHRWEHAPDQTDAPDQGEDARVSWTTASRTGRGKC